MTLTIQVQLKLPKRLGVDLWSSRSDLPRVRKRADGIGGPVRFRSPVEMACDYTTKALPLAYERRAARSLEG